MPSYQAISTLFKVWYEENRTKYHKFYHIKRARASVLKKNSNSVLLLISTGKANISCRWLWRSIGRKMALFQFLKRTELLLFFKNEPRKWTKFSYQGTLWAGPANHFCKEVCKLHPPSYSIPFLGSIIVATVSDYRVSVYHLTATAAVERIICILTISYDLVIN